MQSSTVTLNANWHLGPTKFCICTTYQLWWESSAPPAVTTHQSSWACAVVKFVPLWWSASVHRHQPHAHCTRAPAAMEFSGWIGVGGPHHPHRSSYALAASQLHASVKTTNRSSSGGGSKSHGILSQYLTAVVRLSPTIPPLQLPPNVLFTIFYYLPPKDSSPYNSFSPTIPHIHSPYTLYLTL